VNEGRVEDSMQREPVTVGPDLTVRGLAELFAEKNLAFAPVVRDGRLLGVVSDADLVLQEVADDEQPFPHAIPLLGDMLFIESRHRFEERFRKAFGTSVADLMDDDPPTVGPDATVHDAARLLVDRGVPRVVVVDESRRVLGTIGRSEIVRYLASVEF
jgi:CBS domain-containing protein